jgi:hypothetical protein
MKDRAVLTPMLTATSLLCAAWGWRSLQANGVEPRRAKAKPLVQRSA